MPCFLTVLGVDGRPVAGATVTFVPAPETRDFVATDGETVITDARGLAQCEAVPGACYTAWAVGPDGAAGRAASAVTWPLIAGQAAELRLIAVRQPRTLTLRGLAAWMEVGARSLRLRPVAGLPFCVDLPLPTGADADVTLPVGPFGLPAIELCLPSGVAMRTDVPRESVNEITLPAPQRIDVEVLDAAGGAAIAGACVSLRTTSGGLARVFRAWPEPSEQRVLTDVRGRAILFGTAPTLAAPASSVQATQPDFEPVVGSQAPSVCLKMHRRAPWRVRIARTDGTEATLRAWSSSKQGAVCLPVERDGDTFSLQPPASGVRLRPVRVGSRTARVSADVAGERGNDTVFDPSSWTVVEVHVRGDDGAPVPAVVGVFEVRDYRFGSVPSWRAVAATDLRGHLDVQLPKGEFAAYATTGRAHGLVRLQHGAVAPHVVRLRTIATKRLEFVGEDGKPVVGVAFQAPGLLMPNPEAKDDDARLRATVAQDLCRGYVGLGISGADGVLEFPAFHTDLRGQGVAIGTAASGPVRFGGTEQRERIVVRR